MKFLGFYNIEWSQVLYLILGVIVFILVLGIIVLIHEAGHFIIAKKSGILCHEFSIGMGPLIWQTKKGETMFSIRAIPFGGYVAMAGEEVEFDALKDVKRVKVILENNRVCKIIINLDNPKYNNLPVYNLVSYDLSGTMEGLDDELYLELESEDGEVNKYIVARDAMMNVEKKEELQIAPKNRTFAYKPFWNRFFSVLAGPLMNFVLAIIVFFIMGVCYGYADTSSTKIAEVSGPAQVAGLENNDTIYSINGEVLSDWDDLSAAMAKAAKGEGISQDGTIEVVYLDESNNNELVTVMLEPQVFVYSVEMVLKYDKETPDNKVIVGDYGDLMSDTKVGKAGLLPGDEILKIDDTDINGIKDLLVFFNSFTEAKTVTFYVNRTKEDGTMEALSFNVDTYSADMLDTSSIPQTKLTMGVSTGSSRDFVKSLYMPWVQTGEASVQIFKTLGLFFKKGSGVKLTDLSGPVGILSLFTQLVKGEDSFYQILYWTGLLSVNIGLINLLPLPALDGGRLAFLAYEGVTKKKPTPKVENTIHNIGFILLMGLFVVILISDVIKCF
ncbi:MAG: site-2 protease family protein [Bacilli bacterium]|nr:site-2 protease family protein [Bacilli bacterium]